MENVPPTAETDSAHPVHSQPKKRENERTVAGEHRPMRRADREVADPAQIAAIIDGCDIVEMAYADAEGLTIVPLNFGYEYSADVAKANNAGANGSVGADGVSDSADANGSTGTADSVGTADSTGPDTVVTADDSGDAVGAAGRLTLWFHSAPRGRKLDAIRTAGNRLPVAFTMQTDCEMVAGRTACNWGEAFKSIVGNGTASLVDSLDERRRGLQALMAQQAHMPHVEFTDAQLMSVSVWKIEADYFTVKVHPKPGPTHAHGRG
ncbi:pyridoxamine 5'-phosphate oxidase family protein [Bifidobacterium callitrichidarum]|uniref:Flavin-nucleotide-binding protein n=1 Tax=Bifidobacterium callitrichidarum TaxID=2052941 RepID=A0A2U2ND11_9BIFI|nr:flavin-nucleotide-binding protein [Bifidobacterium callitrichidarum]PWG67026.1 flavin-nucleotide-binding protein [Bifidobacterium callitrichidarum]